MRVTESEENYLESILMIKEKKDRVKAVDIARKLDFSKPSVSYALKKLSEKGLIEVQDNNDIELTLEGFEIASEIYERHNTIARVFMLLGVDEETAYQDACEIEHRISQQSFDKIKEHLAKHEK
ncbi:MAG: metal-dependent transcriptional regulator [Tissierellia bacterium]|nr:metal-dependent transcriptional regulator [Tissierellia bacterium]